MQSDDKISILTCLIFFEAQLRVLCVWQGLGISFLFPPKSDVLVTVIERLHYCNKIGEVRAWVVRVVLFVIISYRP